MTLKEYYSSAKKSFSLYQLKLLKFNGVISEPLTNTDLLFLNKLDVIWGDRVILRSQISKMKLKERLSFLETADFNFPWERYIYSRIVNEKTVVGRPPRSAVLIKEVRSRYKLKPNMTDDHLKEKIQKIRKMIKNRKYQGLSLPRIENNTAS